MTRRRPHKYPRDVYLVPVERTAVREPVTVELDPGSRQPRPTGFWRGPVFYTVVRTLARRVEWGALYVRVQADRGCYDLRCTTVADAAGRRPGHRWELTAELDAVPFPERGPREADRRSMFRSPLRAHAGAARGFPGPRRTLGAG